MLEFFKGIGTYLVENPAIPLFASLAVGYLIAKLRFGSFSLGATVGTLIAAILISMGLSACGTFQIPSLLENIFFALFIFVVGYEAGPAFFRSFKSSGAKALILAPVFAIIAFVVAMALFKLFSVGPGEGAGIMAGAYTQSSIVAAASSMIDTMFTGQDAATASSQMAAAYAITYLFGAIGVILLLKVFPKIMKVDLKSEVQNKISQTGFQDSDTDGSVVNSIKVRAYVINADAECIGRSIGVTEEGFNGELSVEKLMRDGTVMDFDENTILKEGDRVTLIGSLDAMLKYQAHGVTEVEDDELLAIKAVRKEIFLTKGFDEAVLKGLDRQGVYIARVKRDGRTIDAKGQYMAGDELTLAGPKNVITKASKQLGYIKDTGIATDVIFLSLGIVLGLAIGALSVTVAGIPIGLGSGGGALIMGLVFGWYQSRHQNRGAIPSSARWFLKSVGLNFFMAVTGLNAGAAFLPAVEQMGIMVFVIGVLATLITNILVFFIARYVLKMDAVDTMGGLCGAGTATAALNSVIDETGSSVFAISYTPAYALANVLLTIMGPLAVGMLA